MILLILRLLIVALLALTGLSTEDETLNSKEVVNENVRVPDATGDNYGPGDTTSTTTPSELPGPRSTG